MNRRHFLRLGTTGLAVLAGAAALACGARDDSTLGGRPLDQPELLVALGPETVRALGRRYRAIVPGERDPKALRSAILASRSWSARFGLTRASLPEQIRRDFANGRIAVVDGWLLAATEARQCALYSMLRA